MAIKMDSQTVTRMEVTKSTKKMYDWFELKKYDSKGLNPNPEEAIQPAADAGQQKVTNGDADGENQENSGADGEDDYKPPRTVCALKW